jgi:TonB family protein
VNAAAGAIVGVLFAGLWQGGLIALVVLGLLALAPRASASTRHLMLWCGFLAIALVPAALALPASRPATRSGATVARSLPMARLPEKARALTPTSAATSSQVRQPIVVDLGAAVVVIAGLWLLGALVAGTRLLVSLLRVAQIRRTASVLELRAGIPICTSDSIAVPIAAGLFSPAVILPASMMLSLSKCDLDCIVAHELAHVARGDGWSKLLQLLVQSVLFFNPALLILGRRIAIEREIACDDVAAAGGAERKRFARCLVDLAERVAIAPASALGVLGTRNATFVRIRRLLDDRYEGRRSISRPLVGGGLVLLASLVLALQAFSPLIAFATPIAPVAPAIAPVTVPHPARAPKARVAPAMGIAPAIATAPRNAQRVRIVRPAMLGPISAKPRVTMIAPAAPHLARMTTLATPVAAPKVMTPARTELHLVTPAIAPIALVAPREPITAMLATTPVANPTCNVDARIVHTVPPAWPQSAMHDGGGPFFVTIEVTIAPSGDLTNAAVRKSSGRADVDSASVNAARSSTYAPKLVDCKPVGGTYIFKTQFSAS